MDKVLKVMVNLILNACGAMTGNQAKRLIPLRQTTPLAVRHESALLFRRWSGIWGPCKHAFD
jgi:hypothetical protein